MGNYGVVGFYLFPSEADEVDLAFVVFGEAVELAELVGAMFAVIT